MEMLYDTGYGGRSWQCGTISRCGDDGLVHKLRKIKIKKTKHLKLIEEDGMEKPWLMRGVTEELERDLYERVGCKPWVFCLDG